ncbi:MAG: LysR family transcriptional regulator [Tistrella sp.]|jgi:DNA-binding transcriptional LysR family regulator|uniref:LysR family transcriptional regulator n=2 Tax=Tistrella mobilis TaxID=171437 RepID=A0A3B9IUB1_9PROT|nr:LysR family transcriptional regulator [Tistrella sp.]MBA76074.1 LysR family transcriptional regulator [Tistrella sp.]HAE51248.1 LysR family transcriptional regulator [Tistrella mobilis]
MRMAITFKQLRYFLVLAEQLHFGRAAQQLNISQPPLSTSLRQLEETLGFALMERSTKAVRLTPAGALFAEHAARILGQLDAACVLAEQTAKGVAGEITVAFVPSMLFRRLPATLQAFQEEHPTIELRLQEMNTASQIEELINHRIDVGFVHSVALPDEVSEITIETERLVCCVPYQHRLASRSRISLHELAGERVLVFARTFAAHYHDRIVGLLRAAGVDVYPHYRIQHWFTVVALVAQGMGVSLVPHSLSRSGFDDVVYLEIEERQAEHRVSLIWRTSGLSNAARAFVDHVRLRTSIYR